MCKSGMILLCTFSPLWSHQMNVHLSLDITKRWCSSRYLLQSSCPKLQDVHSLLPSNGSVLLSCYNVRIVNTVSQEWVLEENPYYIWYSWFCLKYCIKSVVKKRGSSKQKFTIKMRWQMFLVLGIEYWCLYNYRFITECVIRLYNYYLTY